MTFSMKRALAIFQKDLKDLSKNMYIGSTVLIVILLAALYGRMGEVPLEMHYLVINFVFAMVTAFIQCAIIAEEKEKNTLRSLMLSPASMNDIIFGKSLVTFVVTILTVVLCAWLTGYQPADILPIAFALILSTLFYIALGTILGLLSKSVMEASVIILPVVFIFGFGSFLMSYVEEYSFLAFVEYLPSVQLIELAYEVEEGLGFGDLWFHLFIIALWVIGSAILTIIMYKKREMD
ncbi:ABC transporter permease [Oceanobacillus piezotolerans]|uniref:ABC transporter permease n=1 Tax=Oceanobacillus piezotolerans TaxID=2448030 RepID=A0A498D5U2_9BACI|nr:ABC transporter permease [Oceanobacillus piezotolerans]RLL42025.1 ABC transporter permease [Oceanobacillus piezotolerans]